MKSKLKLVAGLMLSVFMIWSFAASQAFAGTNYEARYHEQIKTNNSTRVAIKQAVAELNKLHYKSYPKAKLIMQDAIMQIGYANKNRKKTEKLAKEGKWKAAYEWSGMEWQYLVKAASKAFVIKNFITGKKK